MSQPSRQMLVAFALVASLPPFFYFTWAFVAPGFFIESRILAVLTWWALVGFLGGGFVALRIGLGEQRSWLLLLVPALADAFYAFAGALGAGLAHM